MYSETNEQCRECICSNCGHLKTNDCYLNDNSNNMCDSCDNKSHTIYCPYYKEENQNEI